MQSAKTELEDLNTRLAAYVNRVKQLKDENDMKVLTGAIEVLEEDLRSLKASYECQVNHLSSSIRIVTEEKYELEQELLARKESDAHFMDRISLESSKNAKLLLDISSLKTELSEREHEVVSLQLRIRQLQLEAGDGQSQKDKLLEEIQELKQKLVLADDVQSNMSNQLSSLTEKLVAQEKSAQELSVLQSQLAEERKRNRYLKMENYQLSQNALSLQKQLVELKAKIQTQDHQNHLMEQALHKSQKELDNTRKDYEAKLHRLENVVAEHAFASESAQSQASLIRAEVARLRAMLETEERRLHLSTTSNNKSSKSELEENEIAFISDDKQSENVLLLNNDSIRSVTRNQGDQEVDHTKSNDSIDCEDLIVTSRAQFPVSSDGCQSHNSTTQEETKPPECGSRIDTSSVSLPVRFTESGLVDCKSVHRSRNEVVITNTVGQLTICEVDPDGRFLRIWNASHQSEFDLGGHELQQKVDGDVVNRYRFGPGFRLAPHALVTLWAGTGTKTSRPLYPPKDIQCANVAYWLYGPSCTTMLCDPHGQVLAWLNPPYRALSCRIRPSLDQSRNPGPDAESQSPVRFTNGVAHSIVSSNTTSTSSVGPFLHNHRDFSPAHLTPDLLRVGSKKLELGTRAPPFHGLDRTQTACVCALPTKHLRMKPKRPSAPHSLLHPEYPCTLGLLPDQQPKASISLRTPPIGILNRPQLQSSLH